MVMAIMFCLMKFLEVIGIMVPTNTGPKDTYGRPSWDRFGMIDPCIKLNLASTEWTDDAITRPPDTN